MEERRSDVAPAFIARVKRRFSVASATYPWNVPQKRMKETERDICQANRSWLSRGDTYKRAIRAS